MIEIVTVWLALKKTLLNTPWHEDPGMTPFVADRDSVWWKQPQI